MESADSKIASASFSRPFGLYWRTTAAALTRCDATIAGSADPSSAFFLKAPVMSFQRAFLELSRSRISAASGSSPLDSTESSVASADLSSSSSSSR